MAESITFPVLFNAIFFTFPQTIITLEYVLFRHQNSLSMGDGSWEF